MAKSIPLRAALSIHIVEVIETKFKVLFELVLERLPSEERRVGKFCRETVVLLSNSPKSYGLALPRSAYFSPTLSPV
jgi:hypothetical protein